MIDNVDSRSRAYGADGNSTQGTSFADPYLVLPDEGGMLSQVCNARIPLFDLVLLLLMWGIAGASSLFFLGSIPGYLFLFLNIVIAIRNPLFGLLVSVLVCYAPSMGLLPRAMMTSAVILGCSCVIKGTIRHLPVLNKLILMIIGFLSVASVSAFFSSDVHVAWARYNPFLEGLVLAVLTCMVVRSRDDLGVLLKWLAIVAALAAPLAVVHFVMGKGAAQYMMARDAMGSERVDMAAVIAAGGERSRLLWAGLEANYHVASLLFPLAVALAFAVMNRGLGRRGFWAAVTGMILVAIIGTCSRSGMLSCGCLVAMFIVQRRARALIPVMVVGAMGIAILSWVPAAYERLLSVPSNIAETGGSGRFELYWGAIKLALSSPLLGHGLGAVARDMGMAAHNTYLEIFAETGFLGLMFYLGTIILSIRGVRRGVRLYGGQGGDGTLLRICLLGLIAMCIHLCTITLYSPQSLWFVCSICVMFGEISQREQEESAWMFQGGVQPGWA